MTKSARQIAKDWRQCPDQRPLIEATISRDNRSHEFRFAGDRLIARITEADWDRIVHSGGGAYRGFAL